MIYIYILACSSSHKGNVELLYKWRLSTTTLPWEDPQHFKASVCVPQWITFEFGGLFLYCELGPWKSPSQLKMGPSFARSVRSNFVSGFSLPKTKYPVSIKSQPTVTSAEGPWQVGHGPWAEVKTQAFCWQGTGRWKQQQTEETKHNQLNIVQFKCSLILRVP